MFRHRSPQGLLPSVDGPNKNSQVLDLPPLGQGQDVLHEQLLEHKARLPVLATGGGQQEYQVSITRFLRGFGSRARWIGGDEGGNMTYIKHLNSPYWAHPVIIGPHSPLNCMVESDRSSRVGRTGYILVAIRSSRLRKSECVSRLGFSRLAELAPMLDLLFFFTWKDRERGWSQVIMMVGDQHEDGDDDHGKPHARSPLLLHRTYVLHPRRWRAALSPQPL
jgi:hypothetical protein